MLQEAILHPSCAWRWQCNIRLYKASADSVLVSVKPAEVPETCPACASGQQMQPYLAAGQADWAAGQIESPAYVRLPVKLPL